MKLKKGLCLMLCLSLLSCLSPLAALPVFSAASLPEGQPIATAADFEKMSDTGVYYLANDIDFSGKTYARNVYTRSFRGVLDGNGHALLNITVSSTNSDAGIFGNNFSGTLKNIVIGAPDTPAVVRSTGSGYSVACVAGTVANGATFDNVTLYCNIKGDGKTAGFTSYLGGGNMTVKNSKVYGSVEGNSAAGFVTMSPDGSCNLTFQNCANYATVKGGNLSAGGIYTACANVSSSRVCHLVMTGCANYGAISATDWRVGGLIGEFNEEKSSTLTLDYCYNVGTITQTGSGGHAGGIVGGISFDSPNGRRTVSHVYNAGEVVNTANASSAFAIGFANSETTNSVISDAYYLEGTPARNVKTERVTQISAEALTKAMIAFGALSDGTAFIADAVGDNNGYPMLSWQYVSHDHVKTYDCGRRVCLDCGRILSKPEEEHHDYTEERTPATATADGTVTSVCRYCKDKKLSLGEKSPAHLDPVEGVYTLSSADHLVWYASSVNSGLLSGREKLSLASDLDLAGVSFTPIASFGGVLDGGGHTIKNLTVKVAQGDAGLFAQLLSGASVSSLAFENASVTASAGSAGALAGAVAGGAAVKLSGLLVVSSKVEASQAAGSLIGASEAAGELSLSNAAVVTTAVSGNAYVGGFIGIGSGCVLFNCHTDASLTTISGGKRGSFAYHTGAFSLSFCYHTDKSTDGTLVSSDHFTAGAAAYLLNALSGQSLFGMREGRLAFHGDKIALVRTGAGNFYTDRSLAASGTFAAYLFGDQLIIAVRRNASERFVDAKISVDGRSLTYADFTLSRFVSSGGVTLVPAEGFVLYVMPAPANFTSASSVTVGSFTGVAEEIK